MIGNIMLLLISIANASEINTPTTPIFLKQGYSTVLEFDENPSQVILGDTKSFQVERLNSSIVLKALVDETTSNMFVYFNKQDPRLFLLTVSDDVEPTLIRSFKSMKLLAEEMKKKDVKPTKYKRRTLLNSAKFDDKKDYLSIDIGMSADSTASITPYWEKVLLSYKNKRTKPINVWAERKSVQKDSLVKARFIFSKPDIPRNLKGASLLIPIKGYKNPIQLKLN